MSQTKVTVNLYCPTLSTTVQLAAREDQLLDLGSIARAFGLEPATIKLNGHFICRGIDLIASSVTWKSLISFFSSRGFSTGVCSSGAIVVDGKLLKSGCKRAHDSTNGISSINKKLQVEEVDSSKKMKFKDLDVNTENGKPFISNVFCLKRKHEVGNSSVKRCKVDESGLQIRKLPNLETLLNTQLPCGFLGVNKKRVREDERILP